jgi:glycosyltransferase involved in cell wall biosynthesis
MITYNHAPYIRAALDSALSQRTSFPYEIVVGDDASTDGTREILQEYAEANPGRLRLVLHDRNIGMIANQNAAFAACSGEYIAMLEGDDYWTDDSKLERQLAAMREHPGCLLSFHPCRETRHAGLMSWCGSTPAIIPVDDVIRGGGYFCPTPSLMLHRSVVADMPSFLLHAPAGDYYLQILGASRGGALYLPWPMCAYRVDATGSWSSSVKAFHRKQDFRKRTISTLALMDEHLGYARHGAFVWKRIELTLALAFDYLKHGDMAAFKRHLAEARALMRTPTLYYRAVAMLGRFPRAFVALHFTLRGVREARRILRQAVLRR